ncbi:hypothetical protein PATSB16_06750 [Pandoraea thiooxydans]|nr:hypothetical protein PATSB16_06750 [Pandoraea thiooxydans]
MRERADRRQTAAAWRRLSPSGGMGSGGAVPHSSLNVTLALIR